MPSQSTDSVAVIIPAFNAAPFLETCLRSVLSQSYPIHEVIVVNDGSKDNTRELAESFGGIVRVLSQNNQGLSASRNNGVAASTSNYVAFLDSDDAWARDKIEKQMLAMAANPAAALCYTGLMLAFPDGSQKVSGTPPLAGLRTRLRSGNPGIAPSCVLVRRSVFDQVGGFQADLRRCEDWELWSRLIQLAPFCRVDEPLTIYTCNTTGLSSEAAAMFETARQVMEGSPLAGLQGPERWLWRRRILSRQAYSSALMARSVGNHAEELRFMLYSVSSWPSPFWLPVRFKALAVTLKNARL